MNSKIIIVLKGRFDLQPPIMNLSLALFAILGELMVICSSCPENIVSQYAKRGIKIITLFTEGMDNINSNQEKLKHWLMFRKKAWAFLEKEKKRSLLWIATADTAIALGKNLFNKFYILEMLELYDTFPVYRYLLKNYTRNAHLVVVNEPCRAAILRVWYDLKRTPAVLPNKPLDHPRGKYISITCPFARGIVNGLNEKKIVLYQGIISKERDITRVVEALAMMGREYQLLVMGRDHDQSMTVYKRINPNVTHIPYIAPPLHMEVTSHAYIAIATYEYNALNTIFCAPNKIWEYSGFGIPTLCRTIPGLVFTVGQAHAGVCVNFDDPTEIVWGLHEIEKSYESFSRNASQYFESVDIIDLVRHILSSVKII